MSKKRAIPGVSFSAKRALGITSMKRDFARATGIPTTRSGRQRKAGKMMGCAVPFLLVVFVLLLSLTSSFALAESSSDKILFRNTMWGMTRDEVIASEPDFELSKGSGLLWSEDMKILDKYDVLTAFLFTPAGRLYCGAYSYGGAIYEYPDIVDVYAEIQQGLISKYGAPAAQDVVWLDEEDSFKSFESVYGTAVANGRLSYETLFRIGDVGISMSLSGADMSAKIQIHYVNVSIQAADADADSSGL